MAVLRSTEPLRRELAATLPERPFTITFWDGTELPATNGGGPAPPPRPPPRRAPALPGRAGPRAAPPRPARPRPRLRERRDRGRRHRRGDGGDPQLPAAA